MLTHLFAQPRSLLPFISATLPIALLWRNWCRTRGNRGSGHQTKFSTAGERTIIQQADSDNFCPKVQIRKADLCIVSSKNGSSTYARRTPGHSSYGTHHDSKKYMCCNRTSKGHSKSCAASILPRGPNMRRTACKRRKKNDCHGGPAYCRSGIWEPLPQCTWNSRRGGCWQLSVSTIRRRLHEAGLKNQIAAQKTLLEQSHRDQRMEFASVVESWTPENWRAVVFTDEASFCTRWNQERKVWRPQGSR